MRFAGLYGPGRIVRRTVLERGEPIPGDPDKFLNLIHIADAAGVSASALAAIGTEALYLVGDDRIASVQGARKEGSTLVIDMPAGSTEQYVHQLVKIALR